MSTRGMVKIFPNCASCKKKWIHPSPYCSNCESAYHLSCLPEDGICICKHSIAPEELLNESLLNAIQEAKHQLSRRVLKGLVPPRRSTNAMVAAQNA